MLCCTNKVCCLAESPVVLSSGTVKLDTNAGEIFGSVKAHKADRSCTIRDHAAFAHARRREPFHILHRNVARDCFGIHYFVPFLKLIITSVAAARTVHSIKSSPTNGRSVYVSIRWICRLEFSEAVNIWRCSDLQRNFAICSRNCSRVLIFCRGGHVFAVHL